MARVQAGGYLGNVFPLFGVDENTAAEGVAEGRRAFERLAALGLNVVRIWLEPHDFFPVGCRLDPAVAAKRDAVHERWWQAVCRDYERKGPFDFRPVFNRKPMTANRNDDLSGAGAAPRGTEPSTGAQPPESGDHNEP